MWIINEYGERAWIESRHANKTMRLMSRVFFNADEGGGGGGGDQKPTPEQLASDLAASRVELEKLRTNNQTILEEKKKLANAAKLLEALGGEDGVKGLQEFKKQIAEDEILKLASEGKHSEAIQKATERQKLEHQSELQKLNDDTVATKNELTEVKEKYRALVVDSSIKSEFRSLGGLEGASPDVVARLKDMFVIENDIPTPRDKDGNLVQGKNGVMTVKEAVEKLKETAPHFWPSSSGANLNGENGATDKQTLDDLLIAASKISPKALAEERARQANLKKKAK